MDVQKDRQILKGYMQSLFEKIIVEAYENPSASNGSGLEIKVKQLSELLKNYKRKAVYQYLPKSCKARTDDVMEEFLKEKQAHEIYTALCAQENEQRNKNSPDSPEMLVKNEILQYAQRLSKQTLLQEKAAALGIEGHLPWMTDAETDLLLKKAFEAEYPEFAAYLSKAEQGDTEAQYRVGHLYLNGFSGMERDYREGIRWLRTAAKGGNPRAMFELGKMKLKSKDPIERRDGLEQLQFAFRGLKNETEFETDTYAKRALGEFYEKGLIFEADPETAAYWYRRAEEQESENNNSYSDIWLDEEEELEQWYLRTEQEGQRRYQKDMPIQSYPDSSRINEQVVNEKVETGILQFLNPENYKTYLDIVSNFHSYSFNNTLLVAMQNPFATFGAGKSKWEREFNRTVREGEQEKGIMIYAPLMNQDDTPLPGKREFKEVYIYDVSQTKGEKVPELPWQFSPDDMQKNKDFIQCLEKISSIQINEDIEIKSALEQTCKDKLQKWKEKALKMEFKDLDSATHGIQEKSISYIVCRHFGLDTSDYFFNDIAEWKNSLDMKEIKSALKTVRAISHDVIDSLEKEYTNLQKQQTDKAEEMNWNGIRLLVTPGTNADEKPVWTARLKENVGHDEFAKLCRETDRLGGSYSKEKRCFLFRENPAELFQSSGARPASALNLSENQRDSKEKNSYSNKKTAVRKEFQEGEMYYHGVMLMVIPVKGVQEDNSAVWMVTPKKKLEQKQFEKLAEQMNVFGKGCFKFHGGFLFRSGNPAELLQKQGGYILKDVKLDKNAKKENQQSRKPIRGTAVPYHNLRQPK